MEFSSKGGGGVQPLSTYSGAICIANLQKGVVQTPPPPPAGSAPGLPKTSGFFYSRAVKFSQKVPQSCAVHARMTDLLCPA